MREFDLSEEELVTHSNDSLIRYIGALQELLRLEHDKELPVQESAITDKVAIPD